MDRRVEGAVRSDENVSTDHDRSNIEGCEAEVDPGAVPDGDVVAVIDAQGRADVNILPHLSEDLGEQVASDVWVARVSLLVEAKKTNGPPRERREFIVRNVVVAVAHASGGCAPIVVESGVVEIGSRGDGHATRVVEALSSRGARRASKWPRSACSWEMSAAGSSGCHCTPITGASIDSMASIVPSGA